MNLAAALYAADRRYDEVMRQIEALLTTILPGWQSWDFLKPHRLDVYGAFDSARGAAVLHARGFVEVCLHDHLATERMITCQCAVREVG